MPAVEEVFKVSGVPTYTFVQPTRYAQMKVAIRTPGRCVVVEGPSGIGKTSSVAQILDELKLADSVTLLRTREPKDVAYIEALPELGDIGVVIVDDFHRLDDKVKARITDFMKLLADRGDPKSKLILIGINKAGDRLVQYGSDVGLRIDVFKLEQNPPELVEQLIELGEKALNVKVEDKAKIVEVSHGSFQIAQLLCHQICVESGVTESGDKEANVDKSVDFVLDDVLTSLRRIHYKACVEFAQGSKLRREGRAPYLHILRWLVDSDDWAVDLRRAIKDHPEHRGSVGQVVSKGYLETLMRDKAAILDEFFHYQPETSVFTVEDPKLVFYLRSINWKSFVKEVGFSTSEFPSKYDVALSFAGPDRAHAKQLFDILAEREVSVFYDENEQHRILTEKVEDYLAPIYRSEAAYVVPLLSPEYPKRIWTKFESDQFKGRFGTNGVIPIRFRTAADGYFSAPMEYGSLSFDPDGDVTGQLTKIAETICERLKEDRLQGSEKEPQLDI
ncbi:TIR domain-containing protein [Rhizobium ruizarguesonis]|uniref:TIR domain-containing protein n=1 Tax=Rhizobium ruizarguesonis TaxID=2081791 RepID=UPI0010315ECD|nr:TIR domain-containing protein [Rhizobium ruizarguesonis]TAZ57812.1 TIR domain-containing protein [Rhizobium ruizarguesonis]